MRKPASVATAALAVGAVLLTGCGGSDTVSQPPTGASQQKQRTQTQAESGTKNGKSTAEPGQPSNGGLRRVDQGSHSG
jgi:hypothetical protein